MNKIIYLFPYFSSAINPIIYSAYSVKFRREFKRMLTCSRNVTYYYRGHRAGGNGTTVSGTEAYISMEQTKSGRTGLNSLQYCATSSSMSNLTCKSNMLTTVRGDNTFLSPSHAIVGFESSQLVKQKNYGRLMKTSASINQISDFKKSKGDDGLKSPTHSFGSGTGSGNGVGVDGRDCGEDTEPTAQISSNINFVNTTTTIKTTTSITLIYNKPNNDLVKTETCSNKQESNRSNSFEEQHI